MYKITSKCLIPSDDTQSRKFSSIQRSRTSTETIRTVRDGDHLGRGALDGLLDLHTASEL